MKLAPEALLGLPVHCSVHVCVVVPVPGPMSPPATLALESKPHFRIWLVNGDTQVLLVNATLAVKSPGLLVIVSDVVTEGEELIAVNVPFVTGVV